MAEFKTRASENNDVEYRKIILRIEPFVNFGLYLREVAFAEV